MSGGQKVPTHRGNSPGQTHWKCVCLFTIYDIRFTIWDASAQSAGRPSRRVSGGGLDKSTAFARKAEAPPAPIYDLRC